MRIVVPTLLILSAAIAVAVAPSRAAEKPAAEAVPLFNGKDLTGWVNVNCAPSTFAAKDGEIVTTGNPTGFLRTDKQYENFVLELDWMHVEPEKMANSGLFVWGDPLPAVGTPYTRGIEVQVLANFTTDWATSHGDVFSIWGATCVPDRPHPKGYARCLPSEDRCHPPGQWNHYKVIAQDGALKLHVNGKEVSGVSQCSPRKGYLALESEGAECHFKNITIVEMPSTNPKPAEVCDVAKGEVNLFTGLDLAGWETAGDAWTAGGGVLRCAGKLPITSEKPIPAGELQFDWKQAKASEKPLAVTVGEATTSVTPAAAGKWTRAVVPVTEPGAVTFPAADGLELRSIYSRPAK